MSVAAKITGLIEALSRDPDAFTTMPPAERQRLAQVCRYIADKADPPRNEAPSAGVLADLQRGVRAE
jgi:hypothetical protein